MPAIVPSRRQSVALDISRDAGLLSSLAAALGMDRHAARTIAAGQRVDVKDIPAAAYAASSLAHRRQSNRCKRRSSR